MSIYIVSTENYTCIYNFPYNFYWENIYVYIIVHIYIYIYILYWIRIPSKREHKAYHTHIFVTKQPLGNFCMSMCVSQHRYVFLVVLLGVFVFVLFVCLFILLRFVCFTLFYFICVFFDKPVCFVMKFNKKRCGCMQLGRCGNLEGIRRGNCKQKILHAKKSIFS